MSSVLVGRIFCYIVQFITVYIIYFQIAELTMCIRYVYCCLLGKVKYCVANKSLLREMTNIEKGDYNERRRVASPENRPRGYKTFTMINSAENESFPAHEC